MRNPYIAVAVGLALACSAVLGTNGQAVAANAPKGKIVIGFAIPVLANPFWKQEADFAQHVANELGGKLITADAGQSEDKQLQIVDDFISRGVNAIIAAAVTNSVAPSLIKAADKGHVPIFFAERTPGFKPDLTKYPEYIGFVGANSRQGAFQTAKFLYDSGARKIVAMTGKKGNSVADDRVAGLMDFAKQHPQFKVLQVQYGCELRSAGLAATEDFLSAYPGPGFDAIWSFDDDAALGAVEALQHAHLTGKVLVTGFDAQKGGAEAIKAGEIGADSGGQFIDGGFAYIMAFDYVHGHRPKNPYVTMKYLLVSKKNIDKYIAQFGSGIPPYDIKAMSVTYNPKASTDDFQIVLH